MLMCRTVPFEIERLLDRLVAEGKIDAEDAALVRRRWDAYPEEWRILLDACERAP